MRNIQKVSDITPQDLWDYLNPSEEYDFTEENTLTSFFTVAKEFIKSYTGQADIDKFPTFVTVAFVLVQDMYDNKTLYVDRSNLNKVVESILNLHSINLLPEENELVT